MSTISDPRWRSLDYTGYVYPRIPRRRSAIARALSRAYITPLDVAQLIVIGTACLIGVLVTTGWGR